MILEPDTVSVAAQAERPWFFVTIHCMVCTALCKCKRTENEDAALRFNIVFTIYMLMVGLYKFAAYSSNNSNDARTISLLSVMYTMLGNLVTFFYVASECSTTSTQYCAKHPPDNQWRDLLLACGFFMAATCLYFVFSDKANHEYPLFWIVFVALYVFIATVFFVTKTFEVVVPTHNNEDEDSAAPNDLTDTQREQD